MLYKKIKNISVLLCFVSTIVFYGCELPLKENNPAGNSNVSDSTNSGGTTSGGYTGGGTTGGGTTGGGYTGGGTTGGGTTGGYTGGGTTGNFTIYTDPNIFKSATASWGLGTLIDFEDAVAASGNTTQGAPVFKGDYYANKGVTFSNPQGYPFYIAPGGLFWNTNKSLSVGNFPFDPLQNYSQHDNLVITFSPEVKAVSLDVIDSGKPIIEFKDSNGNKIATANLSGEYTQYRSFIGIIVTSGPLIKEVNIIDEPPMDGDDVNYDNIVFYK